MTQNSYDEIVAKATDENLTSENWEIILNLCDKVLDEGQDGARDVIAAILKRLTHRLANVQLYALTLVEALSKNCGIEVHREIASKAFTQGLEKIITDRTTHDKVKKRALSLIAMWKTEFESDTTLGLIEDCYNNLKAKNFKFETPQEAPPPDVDDEIRRREEEELQKVLEMSLKDRGGRSQWAEYSLASSGGAGGSSGSSNANKAPATASSNNKTATSSTTKATTSASTANPFAPPTYPSGYVPARTPSPRAPSPQQHQTYQNLQHQASSASLSSASAATPATTAAASTTTTTASLPSGALVTRVRALHTFEPTEPGELGFEKGDIIKVVDRGYKDWWRGQLKGRTGIFPVNYVEPIPEPTAAELAKEAEQEAAVFAQAVNVEKLLSMLRSLDPAKDNLADNEEIQELYKSCMSLRPKVVKLIDKYSQKRADLVSMNESFVRARTIFDRMMEESLARHTGVYDQAPYRPPQQQQPYGRSDSGGRRPDYASPTSPQPYWTPPAPFSGFPAGASAYGHQQPEATQTGYPNPAPAPIGPQPYVDHNPALYGPQPQPSQIPAPYGPQPQPQAPAQTQSVQSQPVGYPAPQQPYSIQGPVPYPAQSQPQPQPQPQQPTLPQIQPLQIQHQAQAQPQPQPPAQTQLQQPIQSLPYPGDNPIYQQQQGSVPQQQQQQPQPQPQAQVASVSQHTQPPYGAGTQSTDLAGGITNLGPSQSPQPAIVGSPQTYTQPLQSRAEPLPQQAQQVRRSSQPDPQAQQPQVQPQPQPQRRQSQPLPQPQQTLPQAQAQPVSQAQPQPQPQQQQQQQGPPYVFDPKATYADPNVQAWASYYAQGGTDPAGAVYFFSVPSITSSAQAAAPTAAGGTQGQSQAQDPAVGIQAQNQQNQQQQPHAQQQQQQYQGYGQPRQSSPIALSQAGPIGGASAQPGASAPASASIDDFLSLTNPHPAESQVQSQPQPQTQPQPYSQPHQTQGLPQIQPLIPAAQKRYSLYDGPAPAINTNPAASEPTPIAGSNGAYAGAPLGPGPSAGPSPGAATAPAAGSTPSWVIPKKNSVTQGGFGATSPSRSPNLGNSAYKGGL